MSARASATQNPRRRSGKVRGDTVTLAHGGGGKAMRDLIDDVFVSRFANPWLAPLEDQARLPLGDLSARGDRLAFTTDSFVVDPLFFPGGDIGTLAVNGTVNDLAVGGAIPLYLSCGIIVEEGFSFADLRRVADSMQRAAQVACVTIVTGDTKVVPRGAADRLFINTAGIGIVPADIELAADRACAGDVVVLSGSIGEHGTAVLSARGDLELETRVESDCRSLHDLVRTMLAASPQIRCLRDATRGGIATVLNEFAQSSSCCIRVRETAVPVRGEVRGLCEILGLDPLYLANEGKLVAVVPEAEAARLIEAMRGHPDGLEAAIIGEISREPAGLVILETAFGGERIVDMLVGEQLPRIC